MARSGMDYSKMTALINDIEKNHAKRIEAALTDNVNTIINSIGAVYSGDAAENYKKKFEDTAANINTTMQSIISQLKTNFAAEQKSYTEQEQKINDSLVQQQTPVSPE